MFDWLLERLDTPPMDPVDLDDEAAVGARLKEVLSGIDDPELGIDILSLGLVRSARVDPDGVSVRMTFTSPACPVGPWIREQVQAALERGFPGLPAVRVELELDPPWTPGDMSAEARHTLGFHNRSEGSTERR